MLSGQTFSKPRENRKKENSDAPSTENCNHKRCKNINKKKGDLHTTAAMINKFLNHYDDSSDEDSVDKKVVSYNIEASWQAAQKTSTTHITKNHFLSFIVHAAGLRMLYSPAVNKIYYSLKHDLLTNTEESSKDQLLERIKIAINTAILSGFSAVKKFIHIATDDQKTAREIEQAVVTSTKNGLLEVDGFIRERLAVLITCLDANKRKDVADTSQQTIIAEIAARMHKIFVSNLSKFATGKDSDLAAFDKFAEKTMYELVTVLNIDQMRFLDNKTSIIKTLSDYDGDNKHIVAMLKSILQNTRATGQLKNVLKKLFQNAGNRQLLMAAYKADLVTIISSEGYDRLRSEEISAYHAYFSVSQRRLSEELTAALIPALTVNIASALAAFHRPMLEKHHQFISDHPYTFYANLRLSNRSQKRLALNLRHASFQQNCALRSWRFLYNTTSHADVVEIQQIMGTSFGRKDVILDLGSYESVADSIDQIKRYCMERHQLINDANIAIWVRQILNGVQPVIGCDKINEVFLLNKLQSIAYLLFGCEVARNPAMSIINQMILDLIIADTRWNFSQICNAKKKVQQNTESKITPMAIKGAVSVARALESIYRQFMPIAYKYQGVEDNNLKNSEAHQSMLVRAETNIVKAWLSLQLGSKAAKALANEDANYLLSVIESNLQRWYSADGDVDHVAVCNADVPVSSLPSDVQYQTGLSP